MQLNSDSRRPPARGSGSALRRTRKKASSTGSSDKTRADDVIKFIEKLIVPSGEGEGKPFKLLPFQKQFVREIYTPRDKAGKRMVRRAILSMGRKNGKTAIIAALVLAHLIGPEAIPNGEIYSAANDRDQAAIVFKFARQIVEGDPELDQFVKVVPSTKTILGLRTGSVYRAVSAEAGTKHGFSPSLVIYDELAQSRSRDLYDALDTSMGGRSEPLFVVISTQSNDPEHILSKLVDDGLHAKDPRIVCHLYAVPEDTKDIFDPKIWKLANPALGEFRSLADLRAIADQAARLPAEEPKFRNLYLNQRVAPVSSMISRKEWMACVGPAIIQTGEDVYLALDLSNVIDLTALLMVSAGVKSRVKAYLYKPEDRLKEHGNRDFGSASDRYTAWVKQGHLLASPGPSINMTVIAQQIIELCRQYNVLGLAYDRYAINDLLRIFDQLEFPTWEDKGGEKSGSGLRIVPWGQGFVSMGPAISALEREVVERTLEHGNNPALNWNVANAVVRTDPAGNRKLDKDKARFRIDGAVALAMACGLKSKDRKAVVDVAGMIG
jgi:phage terminase large subunit-like protein